MSDDSIREEAERLATPTRDRARAVILAAHLSQAIHTIEFLHGCLTMPDYKYAHPEQTLDRLRTFEQALRRFNLLPKTDGCLHSAFHDDCMACQSAVEFRRLCIQAHAVLTGSYGVEHKENAQAEQTAAPAASGDHGEDRALLPGRVEAHRDFGLDGGADPNRPA